MKVAVHGRLRYEADKPRLEAIIQLLKQKFHKLHFTRELVQMDVINGDPIIEQDTFEDQQFDVLVSIGGDGTILDSVRKVGRSKIPIFGVNSGRLGFLASTPFEELSQAADKLLAGQFQVDRRTLVQAETDKQIFGEQNFALNEVSVHKSATSSMLVVKAYLDDFFLSTYWADGLIISTPTGSTGYSLSSGGPIVAPSTKNLIITPIAPHNLNVRPLVISDDRKVKLQVEETDPNFMISLDSQSKIATTDTSILISRADFTVGLIRFGSHDYFDTLRGKLMWGHDRRN